MANLRLLHQKLLNKFSVESRKTRQLTQKEFRILSGFVDSTEISMSELNRLSDKLDEIQHRREALIGFRAKENKNLFAVFGDLTRNRRVILAYCICTSGIFTVGIGRLLIELIGSS